MSVRLLGLRKLSDVFADASAKRVLSRCLTSGPIHQTSENISKLSDNKKTSKEAHSVPSSNEASSKRLSYLPRRAVMYIPGDDTKKIAKIPSLNVDCPVLECEDGVAVARKVEARNTILETLNNAEWVKERKSRGMDVAVRVNSIQSGLAEDDLSTILSASTLPTTLLVPKIEEKDHIHWLNDRLKSSLSRHENKEPLRLILYVESANALLQMRKILKSALKAAADSDYLYVVDGMVFGSDDFCADIGATRTKDAAEVAFARQFFVTTVKSFQQRPLQAIDLVHIDFKDTSDLKRQAEEGARWGFTGKQVIHPAQVEVVQRAFSPSSERIQWAQELIAAFTDHQTKGKGAFTFRNSMIDRPLLLQAQNILAQEKLLKNLSTVSA